jgi:hypothetical protein
MSSEKATMSMFAAMVLLAQPPPAYCSPGATCAYT